MITAQRVCFLTIPRGFVGEFNKLQRMAIGSWCEAVANHEINLFGDEPGIADIAQEIGAHHWPSLPYTTHGRGPISSFVFEWAEKYANAHWFCFISTDIILSATLPDVLAACVDVERPFIIGRRWDVERGAPKHTAELHAPCGVDYFIYRPGTIPTDDIPPFIVSGGGGDNWFVWKACTAWNMTVIDATEALTAIHVNHGHPEWENGKQGRQGSPEQLHNRRLYRADGMPRPYGVDDAPYVLTQGQLIKRKRVVA